MKHKYNRVYRKHRKDRDKLPELCLTKGENSRILKFLRKYENYHLKKKRSTPITDEVLD